MPLRKIIAGYLGGEPSRDALRFGAVLADTTGAELIVAHAYRYDPPFTPGTPDLRMALRAEAMSVLAEAETLLPYGARAELRAVESRSPVQGLHDLAEAEGADLIVVGATTKGALELHAVGSVPERLLRGSPCSVAVAPRGYAKERDAALRVIGVAFDGTPESRHALEEAAALAFAAGATLKLIAVAEKPPAPTVGLTTMYAIAMPEPGYRDALQRELEAAAETLPHELRAQALVLDGDAAHRLIEQSEILSLLVLGSRGYGPLRRALLGSVSGPVLRAAACPVVVVPRGPAAPAVAEPGVAEPAEAAG